MNDAANERIAPLDVLRGAAVLGILLMNIQSFAMPFSAYLNPASYGEFSGAYAAVWAFTRLFADQKFMTIFSLLFGAGIMLMSERTAAAGRRPWAAHYRRMLVLLSVGLAHAYLLWAGDVLSVYAVCGMVIYFMRKWRASILFVLGLIVIIASAGILCFVHSSFETLSDDQLWEWEQIWAPDEETVRWELDLYRGEYWPQVQQRAQEDAGVYEYLIVTWFGRVTGLMLVGMALFKWKVLSALRSPTFYRRLLVGGLAAGLLIEAGGVIYQVLGDWTLQVMMPGMLCNYFASLLLAAAYLAAVMLMHQDNRWPKLQHKLALVGRMAFTNYLAQTVICTTIFYGYGFGLFGYLPRWQQLMLVFAIWTLQITWSEIWLARFQNGPLEWLWRCATYLKVLPLRRAPP